MKKRLFCLLCALVIMIGLPMDGLAADVEPRASDYIGCTGVRAVAAGYGKVRIEIEVNATRMMEEVGAEAIYIFKQNSSGTYDLVYTYLKDVYPQMIVENSFFGYVDVTYRGTAGCRYFAAVGCYAKDSNGSETLFFDTNSVLAVA